MASRWPRHAAKRLVAFAASAKSFDRPIFILAPPRSGSTFLFECLCRTDGVFHLRVEADAIWWRLFPYQAAGGFSDQVNAADVRRTDGETLCRMIYRDAVIARLKAQPRLADLLYLSGAWPIRYLDKTIANCFHLEVLDTCFPDARFVFLVRDPRANIASMIEGWPHIERFGKRQLLPVVRQLRPRTIEHWTYPAPPGWQAVVDRPLAEICAWSWQRHVESVLDHFEQRRKPLIRITYEELVDDPARTLRELAHSLDLPWTEEAALYAERAPLSRTTVSPPSGDKWLLQNCAAIQHILPMVGATARRIGYDLR